MATTNVRFVTKNGLDNNSNSITNLGVSGASLTLSGANALTLTTTGATNITLPTSGTLVTTSGATMTGNLILNADPSVTLGAATKGYVDTRVVSSATGLTVNTVSTTTQTAVSGNQYVLTNVAATTVTLPASPASGDAVWITPTNGLTTNIVGANGSTIMGIAGDMTLDTVNLTVQLRYLSGSWWLL